MTRLIYLLGISLPLSVWPQIATAQSVTLEPGLYDYSHSFILAGGQMPSDSYEYCVREGENSKTLDELVSSLSDGGECAISNVSMTGSTGSAEIACTDTGLNMDISGKFEAEFGPDFYVVDTRATVGKFLPLQVKTIVRRRGVCADSGKNPDDVNPD